jgi:hypothetical protein
LLAIRVNHLRCVLLLNKLGSPFNGVQAHLLEHPGK